MQERGAVRGEVAARGRKSALFLIKTSGTVQDAAGRSSACTVGAVCSLCCGALVEDCKRAKINSRYERIGCRTYRSSEENVTRKKMQPKHGSALVCR